MNTQEGIVFNDVLITPNPVNVGRSFLLTVDVEHIIGQLTYPYTYPYDYTGRKHEQVISHLTYPYSYPYDYAEDIEE